ncbi:MULTISPECIES: ABC transporter permease [unclassified Granulicatella]|uniref:ABC transporter permease n=1 Tax=unclassified Granulicatella TaxID=2630493 RepID=UPI0014301090|nr:MULTISPECIES: ABC transporter permease [unclassified Granulicatella]MBF0780324.1 ABC transporter permease [Granulicatella sp. 19428wC4_WM01]
MSKFSVIWKETYKQQIKSIPFIVMVIAPIIMIGIVSLINGVINHEVKEAQVRKIGVVTTDLSVLEHLKNEAPTFEFEHLTQEQAIEQLSRDDIDGYLTLNRQVNGGIEAVLNKKATSRDTITTPISDVLTNLRVAEKSVELGIPLENVKLLNSVKVNISLVKLNESSLKDGKAISDAEQDAKDFLRQNIAMVSVVVVYIFLVMYGNVIGQEIATEKGTRIMEVVLSSTDAKTHFLGKITGVSLAILTQVGVYAILGIGYLVINWHNMSLSLTQIWELAGPMMIYTILFIILGCFLYIILSALLASTVSKIEDVQKALAPIILFDAIGFYIGLFAWQMPNNIVVKIASWFPLFTPMIMPFRVATDTISTLELWSAIVLMVIFSAFVFYISIQFYKSTVLVYSDRGILQVFRQSLRFMKSERKIK